MDRYFDITVEKLAALHDGLEILELLDRDAMRDFDLHVYGLTQDPVILDAAKEAIADAAEFETQEEDVTLTEVAVAIPVFADMLYRIEGSGIRLKDEEFAYMGENGEGTRTLTFTYAHFKPTVAMNQFTRLALASSDSWLDDFLRQHGNKQPVEIKQKVRRSEEATQPGVPAPAPIPPAPTAPGIKQTSLRGGAKLSDWLDNFLGNTK